MEMIPWVREVSSGSRKSVSHLCGRLRLSFVLLVALRFLGLFFRKGDKRRAGAPGLSELRFETKKQPLRANLVSVCLASFFFFVDIPNIPDVSEKEHSLVLCCDPARHASAQMAGRNEVLLLGCSD